MVLTTRDKKSECSTESKEIFGGLIAKKRKKERNSSLKRNRKHACILSICHAYTYVYVYDYAECEKERK